MQRLSARSLRINCIWSLSHHGPSGLIPTPFLRRNFTTRSTTRQAHGKPSGPSSGSGPQETQGNNSSTWKRISGNPSYRKLLVVFVIVFDVGYGLTIYNTGGLDESPLSPYKDPTFSWLFPRPPKEPLHPNEFRSFTLLSRERISETSSILTLSPARPESMKANTDPYATFWEKGIWSVEIKQPQLQIARRYTPLPHSTPENIDSDYPDHNTPQSSEPREKKNTNNNNNPQNLTLLVRRDPTGEVSNYLHRLPLGENLDIRGGYAEYPLPKDVTEVLFLAGGTGIAPALQIAHTLAWRYVHKDNDGVGMRILWASRYQEECAGGSEYTSNSTIPSPPLKQMMPAPASTAKTASTPPNSLVNSLINLEESGTCLRLSTTYFIDESGTFITRDSIVDALTTLSPSPGEVSTRAQGRRLVLVSGPDGFVEWLAGPRRFWNGVEAQGVTGGVLAGINLAGWEVLKL